MDFVLSFEFVKFEVHVFVLFESSLWLSSVFQDTGDFLKSFVEGCEIVVPLHVFCLGPCYCFDELGEYCLCHGVVLFCEGICFIVAFCDPSFPVHCDLSGAIFVNGCLQFVYEVGNRG